MPIPIAFLGLSADNEFDGLAATIFGVELGAEFLAESTTESGVLTFRGDLAIDAMSIDATLVAALPDHEECRVIQEVSGWVIQTFALGEKTANVVHNCVQMFAIFSIIKTLVCQLCIIYI